MYKAWAAPTATRRRCGPQPCRGCSSRQTKICAPATAAGGRRGVQSHRRPLGRRRQASHLGERRPSRRPAPPPPPQTDLERERAGLGLSPPSVHFHEKKLKSARVAYSTCRGQRGAGGEPGAAWLSTGRFPAGWAYMYVLAVGTHLPLVAVKVKAVHLAPRGGGVARPAGRAHTHKNAVSESCDPRLRTLLAGGSWQAGCGPARAAEGLA